MLIFPPFPSELMTAYPVTPKMNKASFNTPEAIRPPSNPRYYNKHYDRR